MEQAITGNVTLLGEAAQAYVRFKYIELATALIIVVIFVVALVYVLHLVVTAGDE